MMPRNIGLGEPKKPGARIQPHWHPGEERVTILSGVARVGFGDTFDETTMATFGPGSFYLNPPKSHHYVLIVQPTEMQLTGMGPWELHPVEGHSRAVPMGVRPTRRRVGHMSIYGLPDASN